MLFNLAHAGYLRIHSIVHTLLINWIIYIIVDANHEYHSVAVILVNYAIRFLLGLRRYMYILLKSKQFSSNSDNVISGLFTNNAMIKQLLHS